MVAEEERAALRLFLRALRLLPTSWTGARRCGPRGRSPPRRRSAARCASGSASSMRARSTEAEALADADVVVLASEGLRPMPGILVRAVAAGAVPVASRLPAYEELLSEGRYGLEFEPGDVQTLAAHLTALVSRSRAARAQPRPGARAADALLVVARGRRARGDLRRARRPPARRARQRARARAARLPAR